MEDIASINTKLDRLDAAIRALKVPPVPPVATQADLEALGAKLDTAIADATP